MNTTCPWCQTPREPGPTCPRCGANYAKAEAIKLQGRANAAAQAPVDPVEDIAEVEVVLGDVTSAEREGFDDLDLEWKFCVGAIPTMLCLALAFNAMDLGHSLQRMFLTMPVHELGHAVTAWLCGFGAIPSLWITRIAEDRGLMAPLALLGGVGFVMYRAWLAENRGLLVLGGAVLLLQAVGTLGIKTDTARALISFGGDGMGMVLATLLMSSFFFGKKTQLYKGSLRWGFIAIGAAAFVDIYATWWASRRDFTNIPFGMFESGMTSDALSLVDEFGWTKEALVHRYVLLGICCLVVLASIYAWGVWRAWQKADAAKRRG